MPSANPYLFFDGNCEEAFQFYRSVFGGEIAGMSRYSDMPPDSGVAPEHAHRIMHISLPLGDGQALMGSDWPPGAGSPTFGDSVAISVTAESAAESRRIFDALAEGGRVTLPYERQFWGDDFGQLVDRFGVHWMVDHTPTI